MHTLGFAIASVDLGPLLRPEVSIKERFNRANKNREDTYPIVHKKAKVLLSPYPRVVYLSESEWV